MEVQKSAAPRRRPAQSMLLLVLMLAALVTARSSWSAPLEVYGRLPSLEDVALSPDGTRIAFIRTSQDNRNLAVVDLTTRKAMAVVQIGTTKLREVWWADNDHLLIMMSETSLPWGLVGPVSEWFQLLSFDVISRKISMIPDLARFQQGPRVMNVTTGDIMVRHVDGHTLLFVPGYYITDETTPALFRADLQTGGQRLMREGSRYTLDWLVDESGEIATEEDYDERDKRWWINQRRDGHMREIASGHESIDFPRLLGFGPEPGTLLMRTVEDGDPVWRLLSMKDGSFGPPMAERESMEAPIEDPLTHRMIGGVHVDDTPHYVFFDPKTEAKWRGIVRAFGKAQVRYVSSSTDFGKVIVQVEGDGFGYGYQIVDMSTRQSEPLGNVYDGITEPAQIRRITYKAADGLAIPAYLTLPRGRPEKNLPLVLLVHGGPASRDTAEFDWWAQSLAEQGYLVLQANYRGSDSTMELMTAGFGQWGRKMQTDLSDGVRYLVKQGLADPARVCIIGASYGGYAALAGITLDPGIYRCAVSVAGIADLKRMLQWEQETSVKRVERYWDRFMGVTGPSDPLLEQISPIKHLDAVNVPLLLIHGKDDTVVAFEQSKIMFDAMKRAKKDVEMVTLKKEDHWLSRSETRLQMLQSSTAFLRKHNPPD